MIEQIAQQLLVQSVVNPFDDLNALAEMHTQLRTLERLATEQPEAPAGLESRSGALAKTIEQIILRETSDSAAALESVQKGLIDLQLLIEGRLTPEHSNSIPAGDAAPVAPAASQSSENHAGDDTLNPEDLPLVRDFVAEARSHLESAETAILQLESNPTDGNAISAVFRSFHTIKGVAGFLNLSQVGHLAHATESLLDLARQGAMTLSPSAVELVLCASDKMKTLVAAVAQAADGNGVVKADATIAPLLTLLADCTAGKGQAQTPRSPNRPEAATPDKPVADPHDTPKPAAEKQSTSIAEATVKIATDRLDALINTVGELVVSQAMVAQDAKVLMQKDHRLGRNLAQLGKITRTLQELSMSMRMVPIQGVFQKMNRLVRDLEKKTGKEIQLEVVGGETELDRNLVEAIVDPLVHMVRNACDHGIELPDVREQAGKPRAGRIELKAYHHSGNIVIEITDDGRGLAKARILKKAIAAGIVAEGVEMSDAEIFKLIFHAGLSTAEKVTDVSGRGVGMDVVKKNVESLRGRIDIMSTEGSGSTFSIRLPLTLAVIDGLIVRVGEQRFILPILSVEQSLRPKTEQLSSVQGRGEMCMVRDTLLPLYRLTRLLDVPGAIEDPTQALVVIVQDDDRRCCLLVDQLLNQQQVVIKSLGEGIGHVPGVSGGAILGDGNVSLILDVPSIFDLAART